MTAIHLHTPIPGPRSQELMRRRVAAVPQGAYHVTPIFVARAEGAVLEDVDGNRLIDFAGGIGVLFTVIFRRHFLDDPKLVFADGVAAASKVNVPRQVASARSST